MEDVNDPSFGRDDVLVKILRTGICGTDLHIYSWDPWAQENVPIPLVVGHEFVGHVVELGADVSTSSSWATSSAGKATLSAADVGTAWPDAVCNARGPVPSGSTIPVLSQKLIAMPATNVWRHPAGIDLDVAAIFDPFGNAVHTALTFPVLGEDVLITGAGPIGLMAAIVARHAGARYVVMTDISEYRLEPPAKWASLSPSTRRAPRLPTQWQSLG